jgi:Zn-dependent M28 family amino/carboxypeptidase
MTLRQWARSCGLALIVTGGLGCGAVAEVGPEADGAVEESLLQELERHVEALAGGIGIRDRQHPDAASAAAAYVERAFRSIDRGDVTVHVYETIDGSAHQNVCLEIPGTASPAEIVVVGAHYDTATGTPGADDNASGVAGVIALARRVAAAPPARRTIRFLAFGTEEPPAIRTPDMGSHHYARLCRERADLIVAVLSIEMIGYYSDEPGSQRAPPGMEKLYPTVGNFVVFAGISTEAAAIREARETFTRATTMPAQVMVLPASLARHARMPLGANSSDQWSFWQVNYPGMMVTDTANWRNENYHRPGDTPQTLDYKRMAEVVEGIEAVVNRWRSGEATTLPSTP